MRPHSASHPFCVPQVAHFAPHPYGAHPRTFCTRHWHSTGKQPTPCLLFNSGQSTLHAQTRIPTLPPSIPPFPSAPPHCRRFCSTLSVPVPVFECPSSPCPLHRNTHNTHWQSSASPMARLGAKTLAWCRPLALAPSTPACTHINLLQRITSICMLLHDKSNAQTTLRLARLCNHHHPCVLIRLQLCCGHLASCFSVEEWLAARFAAYH